MSNYALRIPNSLFEYAKRCAEEESVSMNQFFVMAIAEKVSALKTEAYFRERAGRADAARAREILRKVNDLPPLPGDEHASAHAAHEPEAKYRARKKPKATGPARPRTRKAARGR